MNEEIKSKALPTDTALTDEVLEQVNGGGVIGLVPPGLERRNGSTYTLSHDFEAKRGPRK